MSKKILLLIAVTAIVGLSGCNSNTQPESEANQETESTVGSINYGRGNGMDRSQGQPTKVSRGNCLADDCLLVDDLEYPAGDLSAEAQAALDEAINDEYKALSTYQAVTNEFSMVRPFSMIMGAETQHIASLKVIYDKYGLSVPANTWADRVSAPDSLTQACQVGVDAEIANAALYRDELLPAVSEYEDITLVFTNLMNASQQKHLPAFERCN